MANSIKVFISSRCTDRLNPNPEASLDMSPELSEVRRELAKQLRDQAIFGTDQVFEAWINEDLPASPGDTTATEKCLAELRDSQIVLVLFNGNAGWADDTGSDIGICHLEYLTALESCPRAVRVIDIRQPSTREAPAAAGNDPQQERNDRFTKEITERKQAFVARARDGEEVTAQWIHDQALRAVREAVVDFVNVGARSAGASPRSTGTALNWARMDFGTRADAMATEVAKFFGPTEIRDATTDVVDAPRPTELRPGRPETGKVIVSSKRMGSTKRIVARISAIPGPLSVAAARERAGQPFLLDWQLAAEHLRGSAIGPIHLIPCFQTVSESQAIRQLGFPDAMVVSADFGVFIADDRQCVQMAFLKNCHSPGAARHRCQLLSDWLETEGEIANVELRATRRKKLAGLMAP